MLCTQRGKLIVRDRVDHLLDHESPFLELYALAGHNLYADEGLNIPAGGIVTQLGA